LPPVRLSRALAAARLLSSTLRLGLSNNHSPQKGAGPMSRRFFSFWWKGTVRARTTAGRNRRPSRHVRLALEALEDRVVMNGSLVAAYSCDAGSGTTLADVSGNGNNGTISNAQWTSSGKFGGALVFNGLANSLVSVPNTASLDLSSGMTLEAWIDPTSLANSPLGSVVIAKEQVRVGSPTSYALEAATGVTGPPAGTVLAGGANRAAPGTAALPLNQWSFVATTYDGKTLKTYVNGTLVGSKAVSGSIQTTADPLTIGGDAFGQMFQGKIDNVRIYNYALTPTQLLSDMNTPVTSTVAPLGSFSAMHVPWGSDQVHCSVVDPAGQNVFFGMNSGNVWRLNEPTGTWTSWHTPALVTTLALAGNGMLAAGVGYGYGGSASVYQINENTGKVTKAAVSDGQVVEWQVLGTPGGVLAFDSWHGNVFRSTDGGLTYQELASPGSQAVYACFMAADGSIYMGGEGVYGLNGAAPLVSHDGGRTWQSAGVDNSNSKGNLHSVGQANNGDILVGKESLQGYPVLRISRSGVVTVSSTGLPAYSFAQDFEAIGNNTVLVSLAYNNNNALAPPMVSFDDGHTWQPIASLPSTASRGGFAQTASYVYYYDAAGLYRAVR
jgi:hypothetical protein